MSGTRQQRFYTVIYIVFALFVNHLSAQNSIQFYSSSSSGPLVSSTEQASVVVEQSEVASGRSISSEPFAQTTNFNQNDRPFKASGFSFKDVNSLSGPANGINGGGDGGVGRSSPIPFVIPSYASGIIFRDSDDDKSPQVEIQPSINVLTKTIGPDEETSKFSGIDSATASTFDAITPTTNVNSFDRKTFAPLKTTLSKSATVTPATFSQTEDQNNAPTTVTSVTQSPSQSRINTVPTFDKTTNDPRFSDITRRIEILGLQEPGYAIRSDGTIDSEAVPPNLISNSNRINPLNFELPTTTTQTTSTTTQRVTRTTNQQTNPWQQSITQSPTFIPSNDNPFLHPIIGTNQPKTIGSTTAFGSLRSSTTQQSAFKGFQPTAFNTPANIAPVNNRHQHAINGFAQLPQTNSNGATATATNPSPFSNSVLKNGQFINENSAKLTFNQPNSRQSNNQLSINAQHQAQPQKTAFVLNVDGRARLPPPFANTETPTTLSPSFDALSFTTNAIPVNTFTTLPTAKAPVGFSFSGFTTKRPTIATTTTTTAYAPNTNIPTTFSTIFPMKFFTTTIAPQLANDQSDSVAAPSNLLLPPINTDLNTAPTDSPNATQKPAFPSQSKLVNRNQQPITSFKPLNTIGSSPKSNAFGSFAVTTTPTTTTTTTTTTTKKPVRYHPTFSTTTYKFTTIPTTTTARLFTTSFTTTVAASIGQQNQPDSNGFKPYIDLLPPIDGTQSKPGFSPSNTDFQSNPSEVDTPNDDLLPPLTFNSQKLVPKTVGSKTTTTTTTKATTTTQKTLTAQHQTQSAQPGLDLNPFLPPSDTESSESIKSSVKPDTDPSVPLPSTNVANRNNPNDNDDDADANSNGFTTLTLEQNPFLPQLDLNPWLPPFIFAPSENDPNVIASPSNKNDESASASTLSSTSVPLENVEKSHQHVSAIHSSAQQPQNQVNVKYTGSFGAPPGVLMPFDTANRG